MNHGVSFMYLNYIKSTFVFHPICYDEHKILPKKVLRFVFIVTPTNINIIELHDFKFPIINGSNICILS